MCRSISLISGKGGSGKTTLALSMASMLSSCGIKVLLIDCDLSTNGATYFYESKLPKHANKVVSFYNVLFSNNKFTLEKSKFVNINEYFDFMPSITQITKKNTRVYSYKNDSVFSFYDELCEKYEIILFDCQAGYTDILKLILPHIDINLVVMEADAISSAAMRSLYLKIGDFINEKNIFQVFNKASKEEYDIYSKVSGGTVFTNIETIRFDWKIRKAFAVKQIPDMENTSANYGSQVHSVCSILFTDEEIKEKLNKFKTLLEIHTYNETEEKIITSIADLKKQYKERRRKSFRSISLFLMLISALSICVLFFIGIEREKLVDPTTILSIPIVVALATTIISFMNIFDTTKDKKDFDKEIKNNEIRLDETIEKRRKLQFKIDEMIEM